MTSTPIIAPAEFDLHAYLDGELATERVPQVETRLESDVEARIIVKALTVQREALHGHFQLPRECPKTKDLVAKVLASNDLSVKDLG